MNVILKGFWNVGFGEVVFENDRNWLLITKNASLRSQVTQFQNCGVFFVSQCEQRGSKVYKVFFCHYIAERKLPQIHKFQILYEL